MILVPVDDSPQARRALELAFDDHPTEELLVVHVVDPVRAMATYGAGDLDAAMDEAQVAAAALLEEAEALADARGVAVETEIAFGDPARTIGEYAALDEVERVVIGSHGRSGVTRVLLGSVAETVARRAPVPVTVVR